MVMISPEKCLPFSLKPSLRENSLVSLSVIRPFPLPLLHVDRVSESPMTLSSIQLTTLGQLQSPFVTPPFSG